MFLSVQMTQTQATTDINKDTVLKAKARTKDLTFNHKTRSRRETLFLMTCKNKGYASLP